MQGPEIMNGNTTYELSNLLRNNCAHSELRRYGEKHFIPFNLTALTNGAEIMNFGIGVDHTRNRVWSVV
jgi:hypothetical protein